MSSCQMGKPGNEVGVATAWLPGVTGANGQQGRYLWIAARLAEGVRDWQSTAAVLSMQLV